MKKRTFAITPNLQNWLPKGVLSKPFKDVAEGRMIYKVKLTPRQSRKLFDIGENIGGWVVPFQPKKSRRI